MYMQLAMREVQSGLTLYPRSEYLLLCQGEIFCQAGESVAALKLFKKVSEIDPDHPLPYLNAARVYQQLGQQLQSLRHMKLALNADPSFSVARVDLAQHCLHLGHTEAALQTLDSSLRLARHVSEIKEVLTARSIATMQLELEARGLLFHSRKPIDK